jgi:hypothetical protein
MDILPSAALGGKYRAPKVGILFHKNPLSAPASIDIIRLRAISGGLIRKGIPTEILAPVAQNSILDGTIPVRPLSQLMEGRYDILKTCYHFSMELIQDFSHFHFPGPIVSRIVRVVDDHLPERDEPWRERLLHCQEIIRRQSSVLVVNNMENKIRWQRLYGKHIPVVLVPTGCPRQIPEPRSRPFDSGKRIILFLGSIAASRMIPLMNTLAQRLAPTAQIHIVGLNKLHWYGQGKAAALHPAIIQHGEISEDRTWDYIHHADIGLALATGPHPFDNDLSKIYNYLRGGLPVLSESPVVNTDLIQQTELGRIFHFGDMDNLLAQAMALLTHPPSPEKRKAAMHFMASKHAWEHRVETYIKLFTSLAFT